MATSRPERDVYRISVKAGEKRVIEVEARRCGSRSIPSSSCRIHPARAARSEDAPLVGLDARSSLRFRGGLLLCGVARCAFLYPDCEFLSPEDRYICVSQEIFPLGGRRGDSVQVSLGTQEITVDLRNTAADVGRFHQPPDSPALPVRSRGRVPETMEPLAAALPRP